MAALSVTHQFSGDDPNDDGIVAVHQLLALSSQTLVRDQLACLLQVAQDIRLKSIFFMLSDTFTSYFVKLNISPTLVIN